MVNTGVVIIGSESGFSYTGLVCRMPHRKWREIKLQSSRAKSGQQLSFSLRVIYLLFLLGILSTSTVLQLLGIMQFHLKSLINTSITKPGNPRLKI